MEKTNWTCFWLLLCSLFMEEVSAVLEHDDIRLVNVPGGAFCEGRLEIYKSTVFARGWFTVCERNLGQEELNVVCRQLGCPHSSPSRMHVLSYGDLPEGMTALQRDCKGNELSVSECPTTETYLCDFYTSDLVGVLCSKGNRVLWSTLTMSLAVLAVILRL